MAPSLGTGPDEAGITRILGAHLAAFEHPGVLSARPGWQAGPHGLTGARAIVATVLPERRADLAAVLPAAVEGVPVELRPADPMQRLRAERPGSYLALAAARQELRQPDFPGEVFFDASGRRVPAAVPLAAFEAVRAAKPQLPYTPPSGATLDPVSDQVSLVLHVSPDAGWAQLSAFLAGVKRELVVGLYDFTSAHVLAAVEAALAGGKTLTLTLDHPAPNPTLDQSDEQTRADLAQKLGADFQAAWALTNSDPKATAWIYPNAYHIKVAVRDDGSFWLSSGNWNNSNQPVIDLANLPAARKIAAKSDRDWHVVVTSPALAATFRAFLENDFAVASQHNAVPAARSALPQQAVPVELLVEGRAPQRFFAPKTVSGKIAIQPVLTPDNYHGIIQPLIEGARQKFYMQTQYIHPSGRAGDEAHDALIAAVKGRVDAGVDVRLITSQFETDAWVEKVVTAGIPASVLRRQPNVHNKGMVIDGAIVLVSSQNWSADGTLRNRDAGLVIHSAEAAAYFEEIFLYDWSNLATPVAAG